MRRYWSNSRKKTQLSTTLPEWIFHLLISSFLREPKPQFAAQLHLRAKGHLIRWDRMTQLPEKNLNEIQFSLLVLRDHYVWSSHIS